MVVSLEPYRFVNFAFGSRRRQYSRSDGGRTSPHHATCRKDEQSRSSRVLKRAAQRMGVGTEHHIVRRRSSMKPASAAESAHVWSGIWWSTARAAMRCVVGTPFGGPLVPRVNSMYATSSGPAVARGRPGGAVATSPSVNAARRGGGVVPSQPTTASPNALRESRSSTIPSSSPPARTTLGSTWRRIWATRTMRPPGSSGTYAHPALRMPMKLATACADRGMITATRSPRRHPRTRRSVASRFE